MKNRDVVVLRKIGNSCVISIPKWILKAWGWKEGNLIHLKNIGKDGSLLVERAK